MLNRGGHCNRLQSKVMANHDFTEVVALPAMVNRLMEEGALRQPPPLMVLNGGGCPNVPTSVKCLTEVLAVTRPPPIYI